MNDRPDANRIAQDFVRFAVDAGVLSFGEFKTKAGRLSPYFFNAGLFCDGLLLGRIAEFYARRLEQAAADGLQVDLLFGPAYKGITLASSMAVELARRGCNLPFTFNRKEAKDHGEGGQLVGAPIHGRRALIVDDVISAGTSVSESIRWIRAAGGEPAGVAIALDRQESAVHDGRDTPTSAVQHVEQTLGLPVFAVATLDDLLAFLAKSASPSLQMHHERVQAYRDRYGVGGSRPMAPRVGALGH